MSSTDKGGPTTLTIPITLVSEDHKNYYPPKGGPAKYQGNHFVMNFSNGYGVSIIDGYGSYGHSDAPYEVAIYHDGGLCYATPITSDVIGYCTVQDLSRIIFAIQQLPSYCGECDHQHHRSY